MGCMNTSVQTVTFLFMSALFSNLHGQTPNTVARETDDPNLTCIKRMELPSYPLLAKQARSSGTYSVTVVLDAAATIQHLSVRTDAKIPSSRTDAEIPSSVGILGTAAAKALRSAEFDRSCGGKTMTVLFTFEVSGTSMGQPRQAFAFGSPNRFWITSEAPHFQP